jgi:hypothetical protein
MMSDISAITVQWIRFLGRNFPNILIVLSPYIAPCIFLDLLNIVLSSYEGVSGAFFISIPTVILGFLLPAWATSSVCLLVAGNWPHGKPRLAFGRPDQSAVGATILYFFALVAIGGLLALAGSIGARVLGPIFVPFLAIPALFFATRYFMFYPHAILTGNYALASVAPLTFGRFWTASGVLVVGLLIITIVEIGLATIVRIVLGEQSVGVGIFWLTAPFVAVPDAGPIAIFIGVIANALFDVTFVAAFAVFATVSYLAFTGEIEIADGEPATQQP